MPKVEEQQAPQSSKQSLAEVLGGELIPPVSATVVKQINALKNLQVELMNVETQYFDDLYLLEKKYAAIYKPLYEKRKKIVSGEYEPTEKETKWEHDEEDEEENTAEEQNKDEDLKGMQEVYSY